MASFRTVLEQTLALDPVTPETVGIYILNMDSQKGHYVNAPCVHMKETALTFLGILKKSNYEEADQRVLSVRRMMQLARDRIQGHNVDDRDFFCSQISVLAYGILHIDQNHDADRVKGCRYIGFLYSLQEDCVHLLFHTETEEFVDHADQIITQGDIQIDALETPLLKPATRH